MGQKIDLKGKTLVLQMIKLDENINLDQRMKTSKHKQSKNNRLIPQQVLATGYQGRNENHLPKHNEVLKNNS